MSEDSKLYVVELGLGDISGMSYNGLFISDMEYKAKWYCSKGNAMIAKYKHHYENICFGTDLDTVSDADMLNWGHYHERFMFTSGVFTYYETKFRTNLNQN